MKVLVLGAGAIGSLYAAKLADAHDVTVLARPEHAAAITQAGLRLVGRESSTHRVAAVTEIERIAPGTLVLLTSKVNGNRALAEAIRGKVDGATTILCIQNGLGGEDIVKDALRGDDAPLVLRAVTQFGAIFQEPGVIDFKVAGYTLIEDGPRSRSIAQLLTASGLDGRVSDNIKKDVWRKLIFNCVINPITSLLGSEVGAIADARLDPIKQRVIDECLAVAARDGVTFDVDFVEALTTVFGPSRNIASMRQDLLRGRATEIDFMNGAVVEAGRRHGIDCPVNASLVALIKVMEARGPFVVP
ncbi:MAG TPA: 2-dehydropantoate 2-reductase [Vicinamibacterales bacterium]|jgi:2-dehydropantoate 2-reductase